MARGPVNNLSNSNTNNTAQVIHQAAVVLQQGGIVLFPTDTVWGILSAQLNSSAVEKINEIKQRPINQPIAALQTVHSKEAKYIFKYIYKSSYLRQFFPSLLTLILPLDKLKDLKNKYQLIASELSEVGIRIVRRQHPIEELIFLTDSLLATSANLHNAPVPQFFCEIDERIKAKVDFVADIKTHMTNEASFIYNISTQQIKRSITSFQSRRIEPHQDFINSVNYLKLF